MGYQTPAIFGKQIIIIIDVVVVVRSMCREVGVKT